MKLFCKKISVAKSFNVIKAAVKVDKAHVEDRYFVDFITTTTYKNVLTRKITFKTDHVRDGLVFFSVDEAKIYADLVEQHSIHNGCCYHINGEYVVEPGNAYNHGYLFPKGYAEIHQQMVSAKCTEKELEYFKDLIESDIKRKNNKEIVVFRINFDILRKYFPEKLKNDKRSSAVLNDMNNVTGSFTLDHLQDIYNQKDIADLIKTWTHKNDFTNVVATCSQTTFGTFEIKSLENENMKQLAQQELERIEKYKSVLTSVLS